MIALARKSSTGMSIGIDDDLFDLGLTSIQAARLFTAIGEALPHAVAAIHHVRGADGRRPGRIGADGRNRLRVPVDGAGPGPHGRRGLPFFAVHGGAGTALLFEPLARRLAPDHPFYGLQAVGLYGREAPQRTIEEMAARYVAEMTTAQPEGPYAIGGYCFGGLVAWEMAHQLVCRSRGGSRGDVQRPGRQLQRAL